MSETTIATGLYTIENVDRHNDIVLADDKSGTLVAGSSAVDADPPLKARWMITRLRNRRYTISPAANHNKFASWPSSVQLEGAIVTSPDANDWVVQETRVKETFVISHFQHQLYWGFEDAAQGSPVRLRHAPTGSGNQWKFHRLSSTTATPQHVIGSQNIDGKVDNQTVTVPTPSEPREVDDGQPARSTPVVPQSVVGSLAIDGSKVDLQTPSSPSQSISTSDYRPAIRHILEGHTLGVRSVAFSPDGKQIVSGSYDCTIRVWDVRTKRLALEPIKHTRPVCSVAFSPDGKRIISGSGDNTVRILDAQSGTISRTLNGHPSCVASIACSPDGKRVVSGSWDETVRVWDVETGRLVLGPLLGHTGGVQSVNFSPDGKSFASGSNDSTIRVWDSETGHAIRAFHPGYPVLSAPFSPDSKQIVSGGYCAYLGVWDMQSGDSITLRRHQCMVCSVGFSPDGARIVSGGTYGEIIVWDAKLGKAIGRLEGHTRDVNSVAFSPDGKWIVSGSDDRTVRIWEADRLDAMPT